MMPSLRVMLTSRRPSLDMIHVPEARPVIRHSVCDASGRFTFKGVPSGKWIAATEVTWEGAGRRQGGVLLKDVEVGWSATGTTAPRCGCKLRRSAWASRICLHHWVATLSGLWAQAFHLRYPKGNWLVTPGIEPMGSELDAPD
jgi:hypothetical protein